MGLSGRENETLLNSPAMMITPKRIHYKKAIPCHRLDRATGGLVLCSKSKAAEVSLTTCFRLHEVTKRYRAIVRGRLQPLEGIINEPINGMLSETKYKVVQCTPSQQYGFVTTVDLWPLTGRRHQLRKHLMGVGHAILGDHRYSSALDWPVAPYTHTLFLWALAISFPHKGVPVRDEAKSPGPTIKESECMESAILMQTNRSTDDHQESGVIHSSVYVSTSESTLAVPTSSSSAETIAVDTGILSSVSARTQESASQQVYPLIRVEIPEPAYYEEFRRAHAVGSTSPPTTATAI